MRKHLLFVLPLLLFSLTAFSQKALYRHPSILGVHFFLNDFRNTSLFGELPRMEAGMGLSYLKGIRSFMDGSIQLNGSFPDNVLKYSGGPTVKRLLLETEATLQGRLSPAAHHFQPYLFLGAGTSWYHNTLSAFIPVGVGVEWRYKDVFIALNTGYKPSLTAGVNHRFYYSLSIAGIVGKAQKEKKVLPAPALLPPVPIDSDHDGIVDTADACPTIAGIARFAGCPDSDGDDIIDPSDKCPYLFGVAKYDGCPIPDSDKDGINDEQDRCPSVPGVAAYGGCPVPDEDGDGVNDEEGHCRTVAGAAENHGCPLIKREWTTQMQQAAQNLFFETGSYKLLAKSFPALEQVVQLLKDNPELKLIIEGHTDNAGSVETNQGLSEKRAGAVVVYLIEKGISAVRLQATGYGQSRPIADNATKAGRSKNRRVELKLHYQ